MNQVEFRQVGKTYADGTVALKSLSLAVEQGEFLALLGPSGCGKSTALRLLAGLEDLTSGDLFIAGSKVNDLPPGARGLGMVFQSYALYPHMSVERNLSFGLRMAGGEEGVDEAEINRRVAETADLLDLSGLLGKKPRELSGGQQQRVAIGRALVRRPKVLLMDEPLSNLDAKLRNRMRFDLQRLHRAHGATTIYVTHDQVEAMTLADRIAVLSAGELQQHAKPLDAYHRPANPFVASFLGTPPMNLIEGQAEGGRFAAGQLAFDLPRHLADAEGPGVFGARPEHLRFAEAGGVSCAIRGIENHGSEAIVFLDAAGHWISALHRRSDADALSIEQLQRQASVRVELAVPNALFFAQPSKMAFQERPECRSAPDD